MNDQAPADLVVLKLGDEGSVEVGSTVHAIGHPSGEYWTYTEGVVSQVRMDYEWTGEDQLLHKASVIQTQTPINPGNSGGPLLDEDAKVIGINSFSEAGKQGLNFAIGVADIKRFLSSVEIDQPKQPPVQSDLHLNQPRAVNLAGMILLLIRKQRSW